MQALICITPLSPYHQPVDFMADCSASDWKCEWRYSFTSSTGTIVPKRRAAECGRYLLVQSTSVKGALKAVLLRFT
jgi:hypothetical protein